MGKLEEIEARRAARRAQKDNARAEQEAKDLEAIDALEAKTDEVLHTMTCNAFVPGQPVKIAFRAPSAPQYKRYCDQVARAAQKNDAAGRVKAQELLAESCLAYPSPEDADARSAMKDAFPGLLLSLAIEAAKVAELRSEEEGKG